MQGGCASYLYVKELAGGLPFQYVAKRWRNGQVSKLIFVFPECIIWVLKVHCILPIIVDVSALVHCLHTQITIVSA